MKEMSQLQLSISHARRIMFILVAVWSIVLFLGVGWYFYAGYQNTIILAHIQASQSFEKDMVYRLWAAGHGGVYVPLTEETQPNPYLAHLANRDVTTSSGLMLTLINPAYMTRQAHEIGYKQYGHQGHITSLNPIRPQNVADAWEAKALNDFENGVAEVSEIAYIGDTEYLRTMRPMVVDARCLKCHAAQGYKEGDLRGGISVSVPMQPLWDIMHSQVGIIAICYGVIWLIGLGGLRFGAMRVKQRILEHNEMEKEKKEMQSQLLHTQKMESVGQLAAGIAHEINTPAQFIGTNIEFIDGAASDLIATMTQLQQLASLAPREIGDKIRKVIDEGDCEYVAKELHQAIEQSRDGVKRVSSIVQAMEKFAHPGSKDKVPQDLNEIIETTITVARNEWKLVAEMKLDLDSALPRVPLLIDEMGHVILNMLINAAHAIGENLGENPEERKGVIAISTKKSGGWVELRVKDNGTGISEDEQRLIFDPFYTTKEVGKGIGQGLAVSHDVIVGKHQGTIRVESAVGEGATFIIQLPLQVASPDDSGRIPGAYSQSL